MSDLQQELAEQRRINAMSAERELKLMSRLDRALDLLKDASDKLSEFGYEKTASKIDLFIEDVINDRGDEFIRDIDTFLSEVNTPQTSNQGKL